MEKQIPKEVMEQYEQIRKMGPCNMLDFYCVQRTANELEFYSLASLTKKEYTFILSNFGKLMKKYEIPQNQGA